MKYGGAQHLEPGGSRLESGKEVVGRANKEPETRAAETFLYGDKLQFKNYRYYHRQIGFRHWIQVSRCPQFAATKSHFPQCSQ